MNTKVKKITLNIGEKDIELTLDECRELYQELGYMFNQKQDLFDWFFRGSLFDTPRTSTAKQIPIATN